MLPCTHRAVVVHFGFVVVGITVLIASAIEKHYKIKISVEVVGTMVDQYIGRSNWFLKDPQPRDSTSCIVCNSDSAQPNSDVVDDSQALLCNENRTCTTC